MVANSGFWLHRRLSRRVKLPPRDARGRDPTLSARWRVAVLGNYFRWLAAHGAVAPLERRSAARLCVGRIDQSNFGSISFGVVGRMALA